MVSPLTLAMFEIPLPREHRHIATHAVRIDFFSWETSHMTSAPAWPELVMMNREGSLSGVTVHNSGSWIEMAKG